MPEEQAPFEIIDVSEVKPGDVGTLSLRYVEGLPVLVVSGGTAIPAQLTVVDGSGNLIAVCETRPASEVAPQAKLISVMQNVSQDVTAAQDRVQGN
jgi:hypothetical protein